MLGANDGIVSVAAITVGVAGATSSTRAILTAGLAAPVGGAISMALGEYVSVSSQRDSERALIAQEKAELQADPAEELSELANLYRDRGGRPAPVSAAARLAGLRCGLSSVALSPSRALSGSGP